MTEMAFETIEKCCVSLKLNFSSLELAKMAQEKGYSDDTLAAIAEIFNLLRDKKTDAAIQNLLATSRLPLKNPRTFENFDFSVLKGKAVDRLKSLPSLAAIYSHKNLAFIGPAGTGKTHLAQAFGYACCQRGLKTFFIKMSELRDKFNLARKSGREASVIASLVRPACLIIDEVGHCEFDKENTRLFFDLMDRRYNKDGCYNVVFTSNKSPSSWREDFSEDDTLLCALDRIFDDAMVITIKGESFRGKRNEKLVLSIARTNMPVPENENFK